MNVTIKTLSAESVLGRMSAPLRDELMKAFKEYAEILQDVRTLATDLETRYILLKHLGQVLTAKREISHAVMGKGPNAGVQTLPVSYRGADIETSTPDGVAIILTRTYRSKQGGLDLARALGNAFGS